MISLKDFCNFCAISRFKRQNILYSCPQDFKKEDLYDEIDVRNQKKLYITHFLYGKYTLVIIGATQSLSWAIRDFWLIFLIKYILLIIWVTALQYLPVWSGYIYVISSIYKMKILRFIDIIINTKEQKCIYKMISYLFYVLVLCFLW